MSVALSERRLQTAAGEEMKIRDAVEADLPAIIEIYNAAIATRMTTAQLESVTLEELRDWLNKHSPVRHPFWVLALNGHVAAWPILQTFLPRCSYRGTAEVSVSIYQEFRLRGIVRILL